MNTEEIKQKILSLIEEIYKKKYIGKLWVRKMTPIGFQAKFGLNNDDKPLVITAELSDKDFIKFMRQELIDRRMDFVKYFIGVKTYPDQCQNFNTKCK